MSITCFAVVLALLHLASGICPPDSIPGANENTCYKLGPVARAWYMAVHQCALLGGSLAVPDDAFSNGILARLAHSSGQREVWTAGAHTDNWVNYKGAKKDDYEPLGAFVNWEQGNKEFSDDAAC